MSEENGKIRKKIVDINVNVGQQGKKEEITSEDAEALASQLNEITGEDVEVATTVSEYKTQKNKLKLELAQEIGKDRTERSRKKALEKVQTEGGSTATGTATLSGEDATDGVEDGSTMSWEGIPISLREYPSMESMFKNIKREASNSESEFQKEAKDLLLALNRRVVKSREPLSAELQNVGDVAKGKKPVWKIKRNDEK